MTIKVLNVVYALGKGGTERAAQNFAVGYSLLGCDSRVLFTRLDGPRKYDLQKKGIHIYFLEDQAHCEQLKNWRPDVVHIHSHGVLHREFIRVHDLCNEAKFVETNVFSWPSPWAEHLLISYQLSHWCNWLFSSRSSYQYRSEILPYPVDTDAFCRSSLERRSNFRSHYGLRDTDVVIGRVGQNFDGKWSIVLVEVFEKIREKMSNLRLLLVNPPPLILRHAVNSRYSNDIVHIECIDGDIALADCYSSMDVFVLIAEQGESFGMVLSESLLCETPVVTLATPWADNSQGEVVGNCIGGYVAASKSQLRDLIEKLLFDNELRATMGRAGRERTIKMFNCKVVSKKSLELINSSNFHKSAISTPIDIFMECVGPVNLASRMILKSEKLFRFLKYTLGYSPWFKLLQADLPCAISAKFRLGFKKNNNGFLTATKAKL